MLVPNLAIDRNVPGCGLVDLEVEIDNQSCLINFSGRVCTKSSKSVKKIVESFASSFPRQR